MHSRGTSAVCGASDNAVDVDLARYATTLRTWLGQASRNCVRNPVTILNEQDDDATWAFDVAAGTRVVRVGLTTEFVSTADRGVVLEVPGHPDRACRHHPDHAWAIYEVRDPPAGEYRAWVERKPGEPYQLSFTVE